MTKKNGSKKKNAAPIETEDSPLEAFAPERMGAPHLAADAGLYAGCDGEDAYVWYIRPNKTASKLVITEVVPGIDKKKTRLRTVKSLTDLTRSTGKLLSVVLDDLREDMLGDLEPEVLVVAKAVPASHTARFDDGRNDNDEDDIDDTEEW